MREAAGVEHRDSTWSKVADGVAASLNRRSFDYGVYDKAVSAFAQDDKFVERYANIESGLVTT